ncbi:hypothetical protein [Metapseudomonas boanensis]|uniref:DUF4148 domain-containing protein n=1 Tax=Metapseudomonas boanensis TaxID=2822138 RepID=A0ABS5XFR1_9GAMM|nr:hypothetical protein [Pseudomonas boanensis]MBT8766026.1 hypothetical protein [Pseudomonas boanensis]
MKSTFTTQALSGLLLTFAAVTAMQATAAPPVMLAENGSDRLSDYRVMQEQRLQARENAGQNFIQMVEEEPSAAGPQFSSEEAEPATQPAPQYRSLIHQQRIEYGH